MHQRAVLAGGCFWGMKISSASSRASSRHVWVTRAAIFRMPRIVITAKRTPRGSRLLFDPAVTSYRNILEFFFQIHDPTTMNRQGNDRGLSYRSGI